MYGSMTSKDETDLEVQRLSREEERLPISSAAAAAYQPVIVSDEDDDDDDEFVAAVSSARPFRLNAGGLCLPMPGRSLFVTVVSIVMMMLLFCFLLLIATDISQRFGFGWLSRGKHTAVGRWVPTVDILNASGIADLQFLGDVGDYELQGLALDPNNQNILYEFHTLAARVLELSPHHHRTDDDRIAVVRVQKRRTYNGTMDFPLIYNMPVAHIGGIDVAFSHSHGSEIWIATHSDGINGSGSGGEGALWAVDPDTLDIKADRAVRVGYNLDWVAFWDGVLYFGGFFNVKSVKRVSIDTLAPLPDLMLSLPDGYAEGGLNYIQSAAFDLEGRLVLLGDDYQCTIFVLDVDTGALVDSQGLLLGSETDGITFDQNRGNMLVGFNRRHSHEQVMGQEPMISVIQLDLR